MMNTITKIMVASSLVFFIGATSTIASAAQTSTTQLISSTTSHLEKALNAVNANDLEVAQEHINAARQSSKQIIGGTFAPSASRGSDAILTARRNVKEGNTEAAADALKEAIEIFKSMNNPKASSQGGLR